MKGNDNAALRLFNVNAENKKCLLIFSSSLR